MNNPESNTSRRDILESIGGIGLTSLVATGTVSAVTEADNVRQFADAESDLDRKVQIQAAEKAEYTFSVTGLLEAEDAPESAVSNGTASEAVTNETHTFRFSGEFTEFSIEGDARVLVDGERFDVDSFPHNTLKITPNEEITYEVSASGAISIDKGNADRPNGRTATAQTNSTHVVSYAGELTYFQIDGDATIRRNGSRVDATDVLPSTQPHEFSVVGSSSKGEYKITTTGGYKTQNGVSAGPGEPTELLGRTVGRYDGEISTVEHASGAHIEIDRVRNEIVARAPANENARISIVTTKGLVVDHEAVDTADFTLSPGQEKTAVPFGDVVQITINDLQVRVSKNEYPEAENSATLQAAAKIERTDAFQRLTDIASGRVRYDAAGISGSKVISDGATTIRLIEHQLANTSKGDKGTLSVRQTSSGVEHASIRYTQISDEEITVNAVILPIGRTTDKLQRETKTIAASSSESQTTSTDTTYTAEMFANTANPKKKVDSSDLNEFEEQLRQDEHTTEGFLSFLNDVKDILTDIGVDAYEGAKFLYDVFKGELENVAIAGKNIAISSPYLIAGLAEQLPSSNLSGKAKLAWRVKVVPAVGLASLADAGFFEALEVGTSCTGCVFLAIVIRDVLLSEGISLGCVYLAPAFPVGVACAVALEALVQYASERNLGYSDVTNELCDGDVVDAIDPC